MKKQNTKIAKELVKIAKSLVSEQNVANQDGEYKNFTGTIDYPRLTIKARVKDANFKLSGRFFEFYDGIWINGKLRWSSTIWHNGTWESGRFTGEWKNGVWEDGIFNGVWRNGTWKDGVFEGIWQNGTWEYGTWMDGKWEDGVWKNGQWYDGVWYNGNWEKGSWLGGEWKGGTWKNGTIGDNPYETNRSPDNAEEDIIYHRSKYKEKHIYDRI